MRRLITVMALGFPLVTGCWDMHEVEHLYYVNVFGLDYQNGQYTAYVQILNPELLGIQKGGSSAKTGSWIAKGSGTTPISAIRSIYATTQRRIFWGHTTAIILSERALQSKGIGHMIDIPTRFYELRYLPWTYCTKEPIPDLLKTQPILENSPVFSTLSDPDAMYRQSSYIPPQRLFQTIRNLLEPGRATLIPELSIVQDDWFDAKKSYPELKISGVGVLRHGRIVGCLSRNGAVGLRWLSPDTKNTYLTIRQNKMHMASLTLRRPSWRIRPHLQGTKAQFDVHVNVRGYLAEQCIPTSEDNIQKAAAKQIEREIRLTFRKGLEFKTDIYGLGGVLYRRDSRGFHRWQEAGGATLLTPQSLRHVTVHVRINNSGRTMEPSSHYNE